MKTWQCPQLEGPNWSKDKRAICLSWYLSVNGPNQTHTFPGKNSLPHEEMKLQKWKRYTSIQPDLWAFFSVAVLSSFYLCDRRDCKMSEVLMLCGMPSNQNLRKILTSQKTIRTHELGVCVWSWCKPPFCWLCQIALYHKCLRRPRIHSNS